MFLKLLKKFGRKKLVLDRGVNHPEYYKAKPWMNRVKGLVLGSRSTL